MNSPVVSNPELVLAASQILRVAHEVEAAEGAIKAELRRAAQAGENARVIDILTRWETVPAVEVLKSDQTPEQRLIDVGDSR
jgi:hypothetical protein